MFSRKPKARAFWCVTLCAASVAAAGASTVEEELRIKREGPFEFAQKPTVTRQGDRVTITFETKAFCDATVAMEDDTGRIVRHFAAGVLGANAPAPFQKSAKKQALMWDSKDDQDEYVKDISRVKVRVSLGLKARFERQFLWSPHRRLRLSGDQNRIPPPCFAAGADGVYVMDGRMCDFLRVFDHEGKYVRSIYPFPADKVTSLVGVRTHAFPQSGQTLPLKGGNYQSTLLTSGMSCRGPYVYGGQENGLAATAIAVRGSRIALVHDLLNRLATDGTTGGLPLEGPETKLGDFLPRSAALSPDGKTLYLAGFIHPSGFAANVRLYWRQGVGRIDFEQGAKMDLFAGHFGDAKEAGSEPGRFKGPASVDVDPKGRVYVADHFNDRVQVFSPDGKHLKSIAVRRPSEVCINQRNGDIYVFSWFVHCATFFRGSLYEVNTLVPPTLTHFGPFERPEVQGRYALPLARPTRGVEIRATIDPWSPEAIGPTVWLLAGADRAVQVFRVNRQKRTLELLRDFAKESPTPDLGNLNATFLYANPKTGELWVRKGREPVVINPESGRVRTVRLPFVAHHLAFDMQGLAYVRDFNRVVRYEVLPTDEFREAPFDYGVESGGARGALAFSSNVHGTGQILSVSLRGRVLCSFYTGQVTLGGRADERERAERAKFMKLWKPWKPVMFEGRGGRIVARVWDKYGRVLYEDVVPGTSVFHAMFMDRDDNVYLAAEATRAGYYDPMSCTMLKVKPGSKVLSMKAALPLPKRPDRPPETDCQFDLGSAWWEGAEWFYGGIGFGGKLNSTCHCPNFSPSLDYFARLFVPEQQHYSVAVLDSAGNLLMRIGQYGNVDDGVPLVDSEPKQPHRRALGGDEVALFRPTHLATHTDRRLYIVDGGNGRIVSVKLDYHATERVALKDVKDIGG